MNDKLKLTPEETKEIIDAARQSDRIIEQFGKDWMLSDEAAAELMQQPGTLPDGRTQMQKLKDEEEMWARTVIYVGGLLQMAKYRQLLGEPPELIPMLEDSSRARDLQMLGSTTEPEELTIAFTDPIKHMNPLAVHLPVVIEDNPWWNDLKDRWFELGTQPSGQTIGPSRYDDHVMVGTDQMTDESAVEPWVGHECQCPRLTAGFYMQRIREDRSARSSARLAAMLDDKTYGKVFIDQITVQQIIADLEQRAKTTWEELTAIDEECTPVKHCPLLVTFSERGPVSLTIKGQNADFDGDETHGELYYPPIVLKTHYRKVRGLGQRKRRVIVLIPSWFRPKISKIVV